MNRQQLTIANQRAHKYPLQVAEKDYFLALAVQIIAASQMGEKTVFKGGTAIHHCYLPQQRFSEDLDFTSLDKKLTMTEVVAVLESSGDFVVKKRYESNATVKIERLVYQGILDQPGAIKVEIDRLQNVLLPAVERTYVNAYGIDATIKTMQMDEIVAEKVRAASSRVRYRDFYDLYLLLQEESTDLERSLALVRQKEVRATIAPEEIRRNWEQASTQSDLDKRAIYRKTLVDDSAIEAMLATFTFAPITQRDP
jgi:predicted nucleotidyltransferase component of viral defense system